MIIISLRRALLPHCHCYLHWIIQCRRRTHRADITPVVVSTTTAVFTATAAAPVLPLIKKFSKSKTKRNDDDDGDEKFLHNPTTHIYNFKRQATTRPSVRPSKCCCLYFVLRRLQTNWTQRGGDDEDDEDDEDDLERKMSTDNAKRMNAKSTGPE